MMLHRASTAAQLRPASPRGMTGLKPDFREGSFLEERDKMGRLASRYRIGKLLGKGGFAKCFECWDDAGVNWALKVVSRQTLEQTKTVQKMQTEISIHRRMKHKNIVNFVKSFQDQWNVYIVLEKCEGTTLMDVSKTRRRFSVAETQFVMMQSLSALEYMQRHNVIHRDLKLGNMMLDKDMNVKIGDFGLAAELHFDGERKRTICGTPNYIAPEILDGNKAGSVGHSFEVDIWSMGVILYTMLVGEPPFQTQDVKLTYNRIKQCRYAFPPHIDIPESGKALIGRILQSSPDRRPSLASIRDDPFFKTPVPPTSAPLSMFPEHQRRERERQMRAQPAFGAVPAVAVPAPSAVPSAAPLSAREPLKQLRDNMQPTAGLKDPYAAAPNTARSSAPTQPIVSAVSPRRVAPMGVPGERPRSVPAGGRAAGPAAPTSAWDEAPAAVPISQQPRLEEDDRRHLAAAHDDLHQSLMAAPAPMPPTATAAGRLMGELPASEGPAVWVTDYADFSAKYGMAYKLSTGHTGVHYNDSTKMIWEPTTSKTEYFARVKETVEGVVHASDQRSAFVMDAAPETLAKKVTLIKYFKTYLAKAKGKKDGIDVVTCSPCIPATTPLLTAPNMTNDMVYVKRWMQTAQAMIFRLSNKTIQVCFFDKTEVILMSEQKVVAYTAPDGRRRVLPLSYASSNNPEIANRLKYTKDILSRLINNREL